MPQFEVINDKAFVPSLEQAQKFVQGDVEVVNLENGDKMLVNEDAISVSGGSPFAEPLTRNEEATRHMIETGTHTLGGWGFIYGNVILLPKYLKQRKW
jgi:hypothetical protein